MTTYHIITAIIDGEKDELYGSFIKADCTYELEAERVTWREQGYSKIKIASRETNDNPDKDIYEQDLLSYLDSNSVDSAVYNVDDLTTDFYNGNFDLETSDINDYKYAAIIAASIINGQWSQAREQFNFSGIDASELTEYLKASDIIKLLDQ